MADVNHSSNPTPSAPPVLDSSLPNTPGSDALWTLKQFFRFVSLWMLPIDRANAAIRSEADAMSMRTVGMISIAFLTSTIQQYESANAFVLAAAMSVIFVEILNFVRNLVRRNFSHGTIINFYAFLFFSLLIASIIETPLRYPLLGIVEIANIYQTGNYFYFFAITAFFSACICSFIWILKSLVFDRNAIALNWIYAIFWNVISATLFVSCVLYFGIQDISIFIDWISRLLGIS